MSGIKELYQEMILEHGQNPRNFGKMKKADFSEEVFNPLCGDRYRVYLKVAKGKITKIYFAGQGCLISKASGSLMSEILKDRTITGAQNLFKHFKKVMKGESFDKKKVGKLVVFSGIFKFPQRIKCALLPWYILEKT